MPASSEAGLPDEGLSLWLTDWKISAGGAWTGRRLVACIGTAVGGHLDFQVHPDGQAVQVWMVNVHPGFQRRGLAGILMDALYAAHPMAWINHGARSPEGATWWNSYREPDPRRNVHNRPPAEWAAYFDAVEVASEKAQIAHINHLYQLDGHRADVYRYDERCEQEADHYLSALRPATAARMDPAAQPLHGATRLFLPPDLHAHVHDPAQDAAVRAAALLDYAGHGNLPRDTYWNTTRRAAWEDAHHGELFQDAVSIQPATHVVFTLRPPDRAALPKYNALSASVDFTGSNDLAVEVVELSWRSPQQPHCTHRATLTPPVDAAIAPRSRRHASEDYQARYDEAGFLRSSVEEPVDGQAPFADRAEEIRVLADRLQQAVQSRKPREQPKPQASPSGHQQQPPAAQPRLNGPGL
ncbi:GNAT family N-acetyltransferase [Streptomyces bobili]|uniref:GNAT family N-acetyltransferase n=1 Tax=Streptomyces bobili TaxID=67280 RepID=UPI0037B613A0